MTTWQLVFHATEIIVGAALVGTLVWAAIQRAKVHRWWRGLCTAIGTVAGCA